MEDPSIGFLGSFPPNTVGWPLIKDSFKATKDQSAKISSFIAEIGNDGDITDSSFNALYPRRTSFFRSGVTKKATNNWFLDEGTVTMLKATPSTLIFSPLTA